MALGGRVHRHAHPEIGWNEIETTDDATSREWWGPYADRTVTTVQWHGDTFVPPAGAKQIARAAHCDSQAFVLNDRHLMLQSHLEMTPELVELSLQRNGGQLLREHAAGNPAVTSMEKTRRLLLERTAEMARVLRWLYSRWIERCSEHRRRLAN